MPFDIPAQMTMREAVDNAVRALEDEAVIEAQVFALLAIALAISEG